jgi:hypothetical protein
MGVKLGKGEYPGGSSPDDFQCFGPPATQDGQFDAVKICDMGCFTQDGKDSNKQYHAAVVQHKKTKAWYAYFEWGRTGAKNPDFQFVECSDESDAQDEFSAQLHSKNDKRGEWAVIAGLKTLRAKPGKDCYLVRPQATRSTGLPDARSIKMNEGAKSTPAASKTAAKVSSAKTDRETLKLMQDLSVATVQYTKGAMANASLPTQGAIDDARTILVAAQKRILIVGDDEDSQIKDRDLNDITSVLYGKIPKIKPVGAPPSSWLLSKNNIMVWQNDLNAFESALYTGASTADIEADPFGGMTIDMSWLDPRSSQGEWLSRWAVKASRNKHGYGQMKVHNMWKVARHGDEQRLFACQDAIAREKPKTEERPLHQPDKRPDLPAARQDAYHKTNTGLLFHGTRSVNVSGILRKSLLMPSQLVGVVITGAMFGPGLYMADDWMKSAGYTSLSSSYWSRGSGGVQGRHAFMFACDTVLGSAYVAPGPSGYTSPPKGCHCVFGKAGHSQVQNNEWIVYKTEQHMLRYLIEFSA